MSACLAGINCKYHGGHNLDHEIRRMVAEGKAIPVCPEQLGGLPTPRAPAEMQGGDGRAVLAGRARVVTKDGEDVTEAFVKGARETLALSELSGAGEAILKEGSPSCGSSRVYDGTFSGASLPGEGVTAALLRQAGLRVYSEKNWHESQN